MDHNPGRAEHWLNDNHSTRLLIHTTEILASYTNQISPVLPTYYNYVLMSGGGVGGGLGYLIRASCIAAMHVPNSVSFLVDAAAVDVLPCTLRRGHKCYLVFEFKWVVCRLCVYVYVVNRRVPYRRLHVNTVILYPSISIADRLYANAFCVSEPERTRRERKQM